MSSRHSDYKPDSSVSVVLFVVTRRRGRGEEEGKRGRGWRKRGREEKKRGESNRAKEVGGREIERRGGLYEYNVHETLKLVHVKTKLHVHEMTPPLFTYICTLTH